jgi:hypothetical protein
MQRVAPRLIFLRACAKRSPDFGECSALGARRLPHRAGLQHRIWALPLGTSFASGSYWAIEQDTRARRTASELRHEFHYSTIDWHGNAHPL